MNRFHLEVLRTNAENSACICRIYRFTDEKIRQVVNEEVNSFETEHKQIVNIGTKGVDLILRTEHGITYAYISNWLTMVVPFPVESCRITTFCVNDKVTQITKTVIEGAIKPNILHIINIENRKYRENL